MVGLHALVSFAFLCFVQEGENFLEQAKSLREKKAWSELTTLAQSQMVANENLALGFLAIAQAGNKEFESATLSLKKIAAKGIDLDLAIDGFGSPLVEVINTTYSHCWANFDPAFNRKCWGAIFSAFPESEYSPVAASRLLMAALKDDNRQEISEYEHFFSQRVANADLDNRYLDAYLNANRSNSKVLALSEKAWAVAWRAAAASHEYSGKITGPCESEQQAQARRECELDTDNAFNNLAKATMLLGGELLEESPLFEMEAQPSVSFEDVTDKIGLSGIKETRVAAADFDNDGDPDLSFGGRLFMNHNGKYQEVTKERGIAHKGAASAFGDFDGDGVLDLLIAKSGTSVLYRNLGKRGKYSFEDVSESSGLSAVKMAATPEGIAWVDVDDDGDLDIYMALYEGPVGEGHPDVLLINNGDGVFIDMSLSAGLNKKNSFCGRGVSPCDIDGDGDSEIFVSNYRLNENRLLSWDDGLLVDGSENHGVKGMREPADGNYFGHTIGSCWGDIDNDGDMDLFSANLAHPRFVRQGFSNLSFLGLQQADGTFQNIYAKSGIRFQETHSDPAFIDIDNDGDLDLSITCVYEGVPSALYQNDGAGNFMPITFRSGAAIFHGWGQSWLDINADGFLDVIYASSNGVRAFINSGNDNHYFRVKLTSKGKDPSAFGAIVKVTTSDAEIPKSVTSHLLNTRGTSSQDEPILHFGLGDYSGRLKIDVRWPDSDLHQRKTPKSDRLYKVKQTKRAK